MSILRPILRPILQPTLRSPLDPSYGDAWNPSRLFTASEPGGAYDLTDRTKLYEDSARTTLVSANGDPIGSATDLSGNGKHANQATAANRPLWQSAGYGSFDGVNDALATSAIDFTGTDSATVIVSVRKLSDAAIGMLAEISANLGAVTGAFALWNGTSGGAGAAYNSASRGTGTSSGGVASGYASPITNVVTAQFDISADTNVLRIDGVQVASTATDQGTGNYGNHVLYIGARGGTTLPLNGHLYRMIVIGRALTAAELVKAEQWCAQPAGVTLG